MDRANELRKSIDLITWVKNNVCGNEGARIVIGIYFPVTLHYSVQVTSALFNSLSSVRMYGESEVLSIKTIDHFLNDEGEYRSRT